MIILCIFLQPMVGVNAPALFITGVGGGILTLLLLYAPSTVARMVMLMCTMAMYMVGPYQTLPNCILNSSVPAAPAIADMLNSLGGGKGQYEDNWCASWQQARAVTSLVVHNRNKYTDVACRALTRADENCIAEKNLMNDDVLWYALLALELDTSKACIQWSFTESNLTGTQYAKRVVDIVFERSQRSLKHDPLWNDSCRNETIPAVWGEYLSENQYYINSITLNLMTLVSYTVFTRTTNSTYLTYAQHGYYWLTKLMRNNTQSASSVILDGFNKRGCDISNSVSSTSVWSYNQGLFIQNSAMMKFTGNAYKVLQGMEQDLFALDTDLSPLLKTCSCNADQCQMKDNDIGSLNDHPLFKGITLISLARSNLSQSHPTVLQMHKLLVNSATFVIEHLDYISNDTFFPCWDNWQNVTVEPSIEYRFLTDYLAILVANASNS